MLCNKEQSQSFSWYCLWKNNKNCHKKTVVSFPVFIDKTGVYFFCSLFLDSVSCQKDKYDNKNGDYGRNIFSSMVSKTSAISFLEASILFLNHSSMIPTKPQAIKLMAYCVCAGVNSTWRCSFT